MKQETALKTGHAKTGEFIERLQALINRGAITDDKADELLAKIDAILAGEQELAELLKGEPK